MTDEVLIGRMIKRLRSAKNGGSYYSRRKNAFTDSQIIRGLGITEEQFDRCIKAADDFLTPWDYKKIQDVVFAFIKREGRWPRYVDIRASRQPGYKHEKLPYDETISAYFAGTSWDGVEGRHNLIFSYAKKYLKSLSPQMIFTIPNQTHRRDIIDKLGGYEKLIPKLIKEGHAKQVQQDDFGTLWKLNYPDGADSCMVYVEVTNSTPQLNKDGSYKKKGGEFVYDHYFLRVPPTTKTAKAAVAWTFNKNEKTFVGFAAQS